MESFLELPVIAVIPTISHLNDKKWQRTHQFLTAAGIMCSLFLFVCLSILTLNGVDQTLAFVNRIIGI